LRLQADPPLFQAKSARCACRAGKDCYFFDSKPLLEDWSYSVTRAFADMGLPLGFLQWGGPCQRRWQFFSNRSQEECHEQ